MQEPQRAIVIQSPHSGRSMFLQQALTLLERADVKVAQVLTIAALEAVSAHEALEVELHFDGLFFPPVHQFRHRSTTAAPTPINAVPALRCRAFQVTVINTPLFGGRWQFSIPEASFSDRLLDIVVIEERDIGEINRGLAHFFHPKERP